MKLRVPLLQPRLLRRDVAEAAPEFQQKPESDGVVPNASGELPLEFDALVRDAFGAALAGRQAHGIE